MKTFTKMVYAMMTAGMFSGSVTAKDLYISANGNDSNSGTSAAQARATLTSLNDIIEQGDVIHVAGMIDLSKEIPLGHVMQSNITDNEKNTLWGCYISYNNGQHNGFFINGTNTVTNGKTSPWKNITITGDDPSEDGFDGKEAMRLFHVRGNNRDNIVTFRNLTFQNGLAPKEGGGAMFIHDNGWVTVENCIFENNHLDYTPLTEEESNGNTKLKNSTSERGGAINFQFGKLTISDSQFYNNHNRRGGALISTGGTLKVTRCRFEGNGADIDGKYLDDSRGGAVHLWPLNTEISATFDHCDFIGNTTWNSSGALYLQSNTDSSNLLDAVFTNCSFIQNRTVDGQGGAVVINNGENVGAKDDKLKNIYATFANTSFLYNESKSEAGAVFLNGGLPNDELRMINCTMAKNTTNGNAGHGAGYCESIANSTFKPEDTDRYFYNCIFEQNEAPTASNGAGEYSDLLMFAYLLTDCSHYGRIMFTKTTENDFYDYITAQEISKDNVWHADNTGHFGDEKNTFLLDEDGLMGYDWFGFTFATLPSGAEELTKGNPEYLKLAPRKVTAANGKEFTLQGYDISDSDQMGFKRQDGKCAIGSMEVGTDDLEDYWSGEEFPYLKNDTPTGIEEITTNTAGIAYNDGIVYAAGSRISIYNISGQLVAAGNDTVDMTSLSKGVYIVKADNATLKVVR